MIVYDICTQSVYSYIRLSKFVHSCLSWGHLPCQSRTWLACFGQTFFAKRHFFTKGTFIDDDWLLISLNHALPGHAAWFQLRSMYVNVLILLQCLLLTVGGGYPHILLQNSQRLFWKQDIHRSLLYMDWNYEFVWDCPFFNRKVILLNLNIDTVTQVTSLCTWCL